MLLRSKELRRGWKRKEEKYKAAKKLEASAVKSTPAPAAPKKK